MDDLFLLLSCISLLCIPIFIIWALINLIMKKPAKKRFMFSGISALVLVVSFIGFCLTTDNPEPESSTIIISEVPVATEVSIPSKPVKTSEDILVPPTDIETNDPIMHETKTAIKKSLDFNVSFSDTYPNDVTGNWRLATISENIKLEEYAAAYYNDYFKSDNEFHVIINFALNTTTSITVIGNSLDVTTMEYVDKEEHDAKLACSGILLSEYYVNIDTGEIEKIQ